jgi:hypothetical protein
VAQEKDVEQFIQEFVFNSNISSPVREIVFRFLLGSLSQENLILIADHPAAFQLMNDEPSCLSANSPRDVKFWPEDSSAVLMHLARLLRTKDPERCRKTLESAAQVIDSISVEAVRTDLGRDLLQEMFLLNPDFAFEFSKRLHSDKYYISSALKKAFQALSTVDEEECQ